MAPEQIGRVNQWVDHRADLYSLGTLFYRWMTGRLPFEVNDPLALIHAQLAVVPDSPSKINSAIPALISTMILKLLDKMPEDRYQTAEALLHDLREARQDLLESGKVKSFELGREDLKRILPLSDRLYGREKEQSDFKRIFGSVLQGSRECLMVNGLPGVGKTTLIEHFIKQRPQNAYLVRGKCDQLLNNSPFAVLTNALQKHIQFVLTQSKEDVESWRQRLKEVLGPNENGVIEVIPALKELLGQDLLSVELGPIEAENRFVLTLQALIGALAGPLHPLILFIDDLQWSESPLLKFLMQLRGSVEISHLLVIGSYRSKEVGANDSVALEIERFKRANLGVHWMTVGPLRVEEISDFLAGSLRSPVQRVESLAAVLEKKTGGNPFFMKEMLRFFQKSELLTFDTFTGRFNWDMQGIRQVAVSENVIDLMIHAIRRLPRDTQEVIRIMACMGGPVESGFLTRAYCPTAGPEQITRLLRVAIQESLILVEVSPTQYSDQYFYTEKYIFAHDRIREAVYALLSDQEKQRIHLDLGRKLIEVLPKEKVEDQIFEVADQLNLGIKLIVAEDERIFSSKINERAGRKARSTGSFDQALGYYKNVIQLRGPKIWRQDPTLAFEVYLSASECAFLTNHPQIGEQLFWEGLSQSVNRYQRAQFYILRVMECTMRGKFEEAISWGRKGLFLFHIDVPEKEIDLEVELKRKEVEKELSQFSIESLQNIPVCTQKEIGACFELLARLLAPTYLSNHLLWVLMSLHSVKLFLSHGPTVASTAGLAAYAMDLCQRENYKKAYEFGRFTFELSIRFGNPSLECEVISHFAGHINQWYAPIREAIPYLRRGVQRGLESGNLLWATYVRIDEFASWLSVGTPLREVLNKIDSTYTFCQNTRNIPILDWILGYRQFVRCLMGRTFFHGSFEDIDFIEKEHYQTENPLPLACFLIFKLQALFIFRKLDEAYEYLKNASHFLVYITDRISEIDYFMYGALTQVAKGDLQQAEAFERRLSLWAENCPPNFLHKRLLVSAEISRLKGNFSEALVLFEQSIEAAKKSKFLQDEAIADELCGRLYGLLGLKRVALLYLRAAREQFSAWGAIGKVQALEEEYPEIRESEAKEALASVHGDEVDVNLFGIMKALESFSTELEPSRLLDRLLEVGLQITGAQRCALIFEENGILVIKAIGTIYEPVLIESLPLQMSDQISKQIIQHVFQTGATVVLGNAEKNGPFTHDPYISKNHVRSVLAIRISHYSKNRGVLYFENNLAVQVFSPESVEIMKLLSVQIAVSIENSLLYSEAQKSIQVRDDFISIVSHELRTPLTPLKIHIQVIKGYLQKQIEDPTKRDFLLKSILTLNLQVVRLSKLVENLLDVSRISAGRLLLKRVRCDLGEIIRKVADQFSEDLKLSHCSLTLKIPESVFGFWDAYRMEQVVTNLLTNAMTYGKGKPIEIEVIVIQNQAILKVTDHGVGISKQDQSKLFKRFERAASVMSYGGLGLGLYITHQIVEAHGGTIGVESELNQGATFSVRIPL